MNTFLDRTPEAATWVDQVRAKYNGSRAYGKVVGAVLWTDQTGPDGKLLVETDPLALVAQINAEGFPLFAGHDPGAPMGTVLAAKLFTCSDNTTFVAAVVGFYDIERILSFREIDVDPSPLAASPSYLDELGNDCWLTLAADPREVDEQWLDEIVRDAPLRVEQITLSHNAAEPLGELIRVGLVYMALVWNPFVTSVASEAGKHTYVGIHQWLRKLWDKLVERRNPVVVLQSTQDGCHVSFVIRGKDVKLNYAAHDALAGAAAQAAKLIRGMKSRGARPNSVTYEFEPQGAMWFPSYAVLEDGRLVGERNILIALEQVTPESEFSIGIKRGKDKPRKSS